MQHRSGLKIILGGKNKQHKRLGGVLSSRRVCSTYYSPGAAGQGEGISTESNTVTGNIDPPRNVFHETTTGQELSVSGRGNILQLSNLPFSCEASPRPSNRIVKIWKCFLVSLSLVLPFPSNSFAATEHIQTCDNGTACGKC